MIKLTNIAKYYYTDTSVTMALKKITLELHRGEFVVITGESGSGKTTLLNVISGMDTYEDGEMSFCGQATSAYGDVEWEEYRKNKVSLIYQNYNLIDSYTSLENVEAVLMICEDGNKQISKSERTKKALEYLKRVGLSNQAKQKASHLSSGQKQRLGIARALAKDTDVLIADEPTGNLDTENGMQVMALLKELSKEKLVIVVTHNYEQAGDYATRKVRIHDGRVVEDIILEPSQFIEAERAIEEAYIKENKNRKIIKEKKERKTDSGLKLAWRFVSMNRWAQPHRTLFLMLFLLVSAISIYIFYGTFIGNIDDTKTKIIENDMFANVVDNRIIVRHTDGTPITDEDVKNLQSIKNVEQVDKYDAVSDINYFWIKNEDYKTTYEYKENVGGYKIINTTLLDYTKYMRSSSCIDEDDLAKGELPKEFGEVVIYTEDESLLGQEIEFYFANAHHWTSQQNIGLDLKVVGILKEETEQVYFSEELSESFGIQYSDYINSMTYTKVKEVAYKAPTAEGYVDNNERTFSAIFILNKDLKNSQVKLSQTYFLNLSDNKQLNTGDGVVNEHIGSKSQISIIKNGSDATEIEVDVLAEGSKSTDYIVEVSEKVFEQIYTDIDTRQASVYIADYTYTQDVINKIADQNYEAVSVYSVSATGYDKEKVLNQMLMLVIAMGALIVVFFLTIIVVHSIMKLKRADFIILISLGMNRKIIRKINHIDLITSVIVADILAVVIAYILKSNGVKVMQNVVKCYNPMHYIVFIVITLIMAVCMGFVHNRYLLKKFKITSLKDDDR